MIVSIQKKFEKVFNTAYVIGSNNYRYFVR